MDLARSLKLFLSLLFVCNAGLSGQAGLVFAKPSDHGTDQGSQPGVLIQQAATDDTLTVRVIPTAVRIDKGNGLFYIVSKAPDWDIHVIFPKTKKTSLVTHNFWCVRHEVKPMTWAGALGKPLKQETYTSKGNHYTKYFFGTTPVLTLYLQSGVGNQDLSKEKNRAEMVCLDYPEGEKIGPVIGRLQSLPPLAGLPLSAVRFRPNQPITFLLKTTKVDSHAMIPKNIFVLPSGYKPIAFNIGLLMPEGQAENTKDFFKEFL
jgi:hypothetical protein